MRGHFNLINVDKQEAAMTITMRMQDWKDLHKQLTSNEWPSHKLSSLISDLIYHAEKTFYETAEEESND